uniref:Uncharacterized protein n=1 Tax=virus sp. ctkyY8 TaxID=2827995 RepID=A0A8S5REP5_9VIRU|nr:MAG TPA: hypothetical protein [virus sp. ctkyY8]
MRFLLFDSFQEILKFLLHFHFAQKILQYKKSPFWGFF